MILIEDFCHEDLDTLAKEHFKNLKNPQNLDGSFHKTSSLFGRINAQRIEDDANGNIDRVAFWDYLIDNGDYDKLEKIITGRPDVLKALIDEIDQKFGIALFSDHRSYEDAKLTEFGEDVKKVFNYKTLFRDDPNCESLYKKIAVVYCPYCNEDTVPVITAIHNLTGYAELKALFQLDHFYPQVRYPFLGLSFFNLVPGCWKCNGPQKGAKAFDIVTHFNPYHKRLDDYVKFRINRVQIRSESEVKFEYKMLYGHSDAAVRDFEIINRYEASHKRLGYRLHKKFSNRKNRVIDSLRSQFNGLLPSSLRLKGNLLDDLDVPTVVGEINKIQLGKLKRDIAVQYRFIQR